jgi:hypothetical protein
MTKPQNGLDCAQSSKDSRSCRQVTGHLTPAEHALSVPVRLVSGLIIT